MKTLLLSFFFIFFFTTAAADKCANFCPAGDQIVQFPFRITGMSSDRCGYPQFNLTCDNSHLVIKFPSAGEFIATKINYLRQMVHIQDPYHCMPKRLRNFSLSDSPFELVRSKYRYFNCSRDNSTVDEESISWWNSCVDGSNHVVVAIDDLYHAQIDRNLPPSCTEIVNVSAPDPRHEWVLPPRGSVALTWRTPDCSYCLQRGRTCGYKSDKGLEIGCSKASSHGIPRSAKYGLIIGIGIPGLLCLIGLACFTCGWIRTYARQRRHPVDFALSIGMPPTVIVTGLDGPTIESYPKTVLGESRRLPKPNDATCPICLSEYQPKETIRTIPECNHCFHSECIDEWLKMNATCPLCRNSPDESSLVTPCSSVSSSATLLSSPAASSSAASSAA